MRFGSRTFSEAEIARSKEVCEKAYDLMDAMEAIPNCREKSLAITKLEECVMWANKAISEAGV